MADSRWDVLILNFLPSLKGPLCPKALEKNEAKSVAPLSDLESMDLNTCCPMN